MEPLIFQKLKRERPSAKQQAFFLSTAKHTAYGGARGGGKELGGAPQVYHAGHAV